MDYALFKDFEGFTTASDEAKRRLLTRLVNNLINAYCFDLSETGREDCIDQLVDWIPKFDPSKGSRAFGYFNVVAKNWLTIHAKSRAKERREKYKAIFTHIQKHSSLR